MKPRTIIFPLVALLLLLGEQSAWACTIEPILRYTIECSNVSDSFEAMPYSGKGAWRQTMHEAMTAFDEQCAEDLAPLIPVLVPADTTGYTAGLFRVRIDSEAVRREVQQGERNVASCYAPTMEQHGTWLVTGETLRPYCPAMEWPPQGMCGGPPAFSITGFLSYALTRPSAWPVALILTGSFLAAVGVLTGLLRRIRWPLPRWSLWIETLLLGTVALFLIRVPTSLPYQLLGWLAAAYLLARWLSQWRHPATQSV